VEWSVNNNSYSAWFGESLRLSEEKGEKPVAECCSWEGFNTILLNHWGSKELFSPGHGI